MMTLIAGGVFEQGAASALDHHLGYPVDWSAVTERCNGESGFICLKHIALLTTRVPDVFAAEYKHFYCKYNEPSCVKLLKLDILTAVATQATDAAPSRQRGAGPPDSSRPRPPPEQATVPEIVDEIAEYITEPDANVARAAVAAIGKLGVRVPECGGGVVRGRRGARRPRDARAPETRRGLCD